jgi:hypothetical protein
MNTYIAPSFAQILHKLGARVNGKNRSSCPIHSGRNPSALVFDDSDDHYFCFVCGARGDRVDLIRQALGLSFRDALAWAGVYPARLKPGCTRNADSAALEQRRRRRALAEWAASTGKRLRRYLFDLDRIAFHARQRLIENPDDQAAWDLARIAFVDEARTEYLVEMLDGDEQAQREAFRLIEGEEVAL